MKKKVVRFDFWLNPAFDTHMRSLSDVDLTVCSHADEDARNLDALRDAHVYHICAACRLSTASVSIKTAMDLTIDGSVVASMSST